MKIIDKMALKNRNNTEYEGVTIAFLGDSVTQGCFEVYQTVNGGIETIFDSQYSYPQYFMQVLRTLYPIVPINIINAGISGSTAALGIKRVKRDVISHNPDLVVVCFGLNDVNACSIDEYANNLEAIFSELSAAHIETVFMTPNMMCTEINPHIMNKSFIPIAERCKEAEVGGKLDKYLDVARDICQRNGVRICDCYKRWKTLSMAGINTTDLLSNAINHPTREMNWLFAISLVECIFDMKS